MVLNEMIYKLRTDAKMSQEDFAKLFQYGGMDAGLAASIFHTRQLLIPDLKKYLRGCGVEVRL